MPPTHPSQADVAAYRTLIAHETEPKEQDFYRTRLQRLEQATEPVCEFDCRSRVAAAGVGVYCPQCSAKSADTDLATQLAKAIRAAWVDRLDWDELAHAALKFLTAAGRLIPAGGMALTAEQVEDVRKVAFTKSGSDTYLLTGETVDRLRALFPATEPAEVNESLIEKSSLGTESAQALISTVSPEHGRRVAQEAARREAGTKVKLTELQRDLLQRIVDQWTKGAGWTHVFWSGTVEALISAGCIVRHEEAFNEYRPTIFGEKALAPAEPAEEETKAERRDPDALAKRMALIWHDGWDTCGERERDYLRRAAEMAHSYYFSSPVVPAPTETEWQTLAEVPADVARVVDARGRELSRGDHGWKPYYLPQVSAPFVAVREQS